MRFFYTLLFVLLLSPLSFAQKLEPQSVAPDFELKDINGQKHSLSQYKGKIVVLEWTNHTCPFVVKHYELGTMSALSAKHSDVVWLTIDSSHYFDLEKNKEWAKQSQVKTLLDDRTGDVGQKYGALSTPHMFVIDAQGKIAYQGAIDDDAYFEKNKDAKVNYVDLAVTALKAGKKVDMPYVKQYGCSVKYKR
jgi:peroxiredoxin